MKNWKESYPSNRVIWTAIGEDGFLGLEFSQTQASWPSLR